MSQALTPHAPTNPFPFEGLVTSGNGKKMADLLPKLSEQQQMLADLAAKHWQQITAAHGDAPHAMIEAMQKIWGTPQTLATAFHTFSDYAVDVTQRGILFLDIMRQVGNQSVEQMKGGTVPVLVYDWDMVVDGRTLERPVNYALVHIKPPEGVQVDPALRPYMIIDPRAGHGPGIGGFKSDSQVGVALAHGHPVYFVIFFPNPEPGQTLADVCTAEGHFLREVVQRHPAAPKPVVVGNCQGGWAAMLLAASNPYVTGPIVVNGAPMSYWAGVRGKNPLRYLGGLAGGALPALLLSDLGSGRFDGANLVQNFESMNPGNTKWSKYYNVFANADTEGPRFIGFERWWSNFYLMNEAEISWIVQNLFVGDKLENGEANLFGRGPVDLKRIKSPIIVFASHGDDITPPQQALNWIPKVYGDEREIRARGQRIIYMVHHNIGHLGIFVSAKVALKEHDRIVSTLEMIEALAPGLYEMRVEQKIGEGVHAQFVMSVEERSIEDLRKLDDGNDDEVPFEIVSRLSRFGVDAYEMTARPIIKATVTPAMSEALVKAHPLRMRRVMVSDQNPAMRPVAAMAETVRTARKPVPADNPFVQTERLLAGMVEKTLNFWSDVQGAQKEMMFFALYSNPFLAHLAKPRHAEPAPGFGDPLREIPQVQDALARISQGGFAEAVIRMLILMARSRGAVRQSRLERSNLVLSTTAPFDVLGEDARTHIIHQQTLIIDFEPERAIATLPVMLPNAADRTRAIELLETIAGDPAEMSEPTVQMLGRLRAVLATAPDAMTPSSPEAEPVSRTRPTAGRRAPQEPANVGESEAIG